MVMAKFLFKEGNGSHEIVIVSKTLIEDSFPVLLHHRRPPQPNPSAPPPPLTAITTRLLRTSTTTKLQAVLKSDCGRFSFANDCKTKEVLGAGGAVVMFRGHQGSTSVVKFQSLFHEFWGGFGAQTE
ncbi:uncharacterized protein LOC131306896 [Rhododendron vialii]|uniref:uncharacterized protein LOC131306896 n=1 Tax=Rhododendron vialii TaxID=182163 RepID=UPI0026602C8B|nr:uncharacterized protein LOC131306896 [Rhododendron vialii]